MRRFAQTLLFFSMALVGFRQALAQGEIKSGIDGNDRRKGAHKSGAIAESEGLVCRLTKSLRKIYPLQLPSS